MLMKKNTATNVISKTLLALVAAYFLTAAAHAAETKIAVIDLKRVFDNYWKKKQAQAQIDDQKADFEKKFKGMSDDYQKANEEYKKLMESANDQAVSNDEREKRKSAAEKKLLEIKEIEQTANLYRKNSTENLDIQSRRMAGNILKDIRELIDARAKAAGYSLVIDTQSSADAAIVLYTNGQNDITEEILSQLNAGAPVGLAKPDEDKEKTNLKSDEKKEGRKK
jgi:outer membrane protein